MRRTVEQENRENIYYIDSSDLGYAHLVEMTKVLFEKKAVAIMDYPSALVELAKYIEGRDKKESINHG